MKASTNNKCKAFTSLEQSRKLSEFLSHESADMFIADVAIHKDQAHSYNFHVLTTWGCKTFAEIKERESKYVKFIPCWSLAALIRILPNGTNMIKEEADTENEKYMCTVGIEDDIISTFGNNPIDACYEIIIKLHELNLL